MVKIFLYLDTLQWVKVYNELSSNHLCKYIYNCHNSAAIESNF